MYPLDLRICKHTKIQSSKGQRKNCQKRLDWKKLFGQKKIPLEKILSWQPRQRFDNVFFGCGVVNFDLKTKTLLFYWEIDNYFSNSFCNGKPIKMWVIQAKFPKSLEFVLRLGAQSNVVKYFEGSNAVKTTSMRN